jgi:hypothetical protein
MRENLALAADICILVFALSTFLKGWARGRMKARQKNADATEPLIKIPAGHEHKDAEDKDLH